MTRSLFERWLEESLGTIPLRTNSLMVTLFGDAIAPHGGAALLGGLIELVAPLGVNDRAVRTSVFRLMQENWLFATPTGRRSEYSLTATGHRRIAHAYRRIYDTPQNAWNGEWQLVIVPDGALATESRETLRRELLWDGFGTIAPGVFGLPSADARRVREILSANNADAKVAHLSATSLTGIASEPLREIVEQCWRLGELASDYERFIARFEPMLDWVAGASSMHAKQCFLLRTLLIHEFRRIQLRDPQLPESLLSKDWPGLAARTLCKQLYEKTLLNSEIHVCNTVHTKEGPLPPANAELFERFGGLLLSAAA